MRKTLSFALFSIALLSAVGARAQNPNYNVGPVWRVTYIHLKPAQGNAFGNDVRQHLKPIGDEEKKQGLIMDYKIFTNPVANQPNDWDVTIATLYPNWAALDQIDAKAFSIVEKHFGSREAITEETRKRNEIGEVVASHLAHEVTPK